VAAHPVEQMAWPGVGARLSYPDWIVETLASELGDEAVPAMERMNEPPPVSARDDGYVQDVASQWVAAAVGATVGERVLDVCAAPGGKATAVAASGALVIGGDRRPSRARLLARNVAGLERRLPVVIADGARPPFPPATFDAVLVDAPCSGLGALRRRPDARWRIERSDVDALVEVQRALLTEAAGLVAPNGRLVYSVCTVTSAESIDHPVPDGFDVDDRQPPAGEWRAFGPGWRVLPQDADTDGMVLVRYRRRP
jgi:16S rRNA (cytosine967-C5)-methyltransferase